MSILIVDDNAPMRQMIRRLIEPLATSIYECSDGLDAAKSYRQFQPDWVLMDIEMPNVDGLTATRQIIADYPAAKIVMVTNYDETDLREAANEAGATGYVVKDDLLALRSYLDEFSGD
jgi:CheY-like chemotaxis protein